jgi:hypothetical protein
MTRRQPTPLCAVQKLHPASAERIASSRVAASGWSKTAV